MNNNQIQSDRILLIEVASILKCCKRTAEKWAHRHGISLYADGPNNSKYMSRVQFALAYYKNFINYYQERYTENWMDALLAHCNINIFLMQELNDQKKKKKLSECVYHPTEAEEIILSRLVDNL